MASTHPYYRKRLPAGKKESDYWGDGWLIDLNRTQLDEARFDRVPQSRALFDDRAAAAIRTAAGMDGTDGNGPPSIWPRVALTFVLAPTEDDPVHFDRVPAPEPRFNGIENLFEARDLLEMKWYGDKAPTIHLPRAKCLALLAYLDYFPDNPRVGLGLRSMVSRAILAASPGWCGTFGPGVDGLFSLKGAEGNYDMSEMHLVAMAYRHYDDLSPAARDHLIRQLLANGRIHRPNEDDTFTRDSNPNDWGRAGFVSPLGFHVEVGETENHILMIQTARYLTNQLLYQRDRKLEHDNRRNDTEDSPSCFSLLLSLLRDMLRGDFSEYNAKNYQSETRWALLNLCTYAYDHEVRLAARMVLDYRSAHLAVSTNNLRRMVPFRRRLSDKNSAHTREGFMTVSLLTEDTADPMGPYYAMQAGNTRGYRLPGSGAPPLYGIRDGGSDLSMEVLSDYRLPPSIHDLFVNDRHRRFFQRLRRRPRENLGGNRNCDNMEIYAGSPSYLITAGGAPATWAVDPSIHALIDGEMQSQQLGVAVTTSFMPTAFNLRDAGELIQFGAFSRKNKFWTRVKILGHDVTELNVVILDSVENYGVAPDFACGHQVYLPSWVNRSNTEGARDGVPQDPHTTPGFSFVNMGRPRLGKVNVNFAPGFYLAIYQETPGGFALMEAFDTWLNPRVAFSEFKRDVLARNAGVRIFNNVTTHYTTHNGNHLDLVVWSNHEGRSSASGAQVLDVRYGGAGSVDGIGHAEEINTKKLLSGTIMTSPEDGKVVISNPALLSTLTLDFTDEAHPRRFDSQTREFEVAGFHNEVWLDFEYNGPTDGDVCRPLNKLGRAIDAVADGGVIRVVPGRTSERGTIGGNKSFKLVAPAGGVTIGTPDTRPVLSVDVLDGVSNRDVWVQFDWPKINHGDVPFLFTNLAAAIQVVADGGVVNIEPGTTPERLTIGGNKRFTLVAPIGDVTIGAK
ncbi:MAG TPA: hypothetical protein VGB98_24580 [Pyrinomonadaceae bacterium]|jgi:hypothetical protein